MAEIQKSGECTDKKMGRIGYRPYWVLSFSVLVRAVHQVGAALFLASFLLDEVVHLPTLYLGIVFASGVVLFFTEWMRHRQICRELSGMSTLIKLILLGAAYHGFFPASATVLSAFVLASISAHAPKQLRHRLLY